MGTLQDIRDALRARLRDQSNATLAMVDRAAKCIRYLHLHSCTVQQVTVHRDYVVIDIDQPSDWLKGSIQVRRFNGRAREIVLVAKVLDCQVQWIERDEHPLLRKEAGQ